ncbi:hypothetical protein SVIO_040760 [Streptomyces violaceusniger]|uniref:DJ-1/PfpI domain-containing protein n=1 Tax=Streptomyces violaceusniger TaxID=68280 RepID=A0A4D4L618_STRVO|nr:hypothetical protein SVIO_040760 [Streptomyces violaceusniger]
MPIDPDPAERRAPGTRGAPGTRPASAAPSRAREARDLADRAALLDRLMHPDPRPGAHKVVVLALDGVYPFELGIPHRVLGSADGRYEVLSASADGRPVRTDSDLTVTPGHGPEVLAEADTVVIPPYAISRASAAAPDPQALAALARVRPGTRLVSICTGAFLLAAAGLLDGRRATTHWALSDHFRELFPRVELDADVLFVDHGDVLTSAGRRAGSTSACTWCARTTAARWPTRSPAAASCRRTGTAGRRSTSSGRCRRRAKPAPGRPATGHWGGWNCRCRSTSWPRTRR